MRAGLVGALVLAGAIPAAAQTPAISWFAVAGGGGMNSTGGGYSLSGTIGQPEASTPLTGGAFGERGGFWATEPAHLASGDYDGDGRSDLLWRNVGPGTATGALYVWLMSGKDIASSTYLDPIESDWVVQKVGDFNGDGKSDILWRNMQPGAPDASKLYMWIMDGSRVVTGTGYPDSQADFTWEVQGVGDLNGDGKTDIVWRNVGPGAAA